MLKKLTFSKIGSYFNRPDWRYGLLKDPVDKFNPNAFKYHLREDKDATEVELANLIHGQYLKRFIKRNKPHSFRINTTLSETGREIFNALTPEEQRVFSIQQRREMAEAGIPLVSFTKDEKLNKVNWQWRLRYIDEINDEYVKKLIRHYAHIEHNEFIEQAIALKESPDLDNTMSHIGYYIYLNKKDIEIAKKFNYKPLQIEALRFLFFDYTKAPKITDVVANTSYLRQLVNNGVLTEQEYNTYKIMNQLGEVGLKAKSDVKSLNPMELKFVNSYVRKGVLEKLFDLDQSVRTNADARAYVVAANSYINIELENEKIRYSNARTDNELAKTEKLRGELGSGADKLLSTDSQALMVMDDLHKKTITNPPPPTVRSLDDLIVKD